MTRSTRERERPRTQRLNYKSKRDTADNACDTDVDAHVELSLLAGKHSVSHNAEMT